MHLPYAYTKQAPRGSVVVLETVLGPQLLTDEMPTEDAVRLTRKINTRTITYADHQQRR